MRCVICNGTDWENVDQFRNIPQTMAMCTGCGFVSYPEKHKKKKEVLDYYRTSYRAAPTVDNLYTGTRKLHYHAEFLQDVVREWAEAGKTSPVINDVGAAYGLFLNWWRQLKHPETGEVLFPSPDLNGVELTTSFKRNAYHEFGLDLKDDFDDSKKYDMITSYKVAEHIFDIDVELKRYWEALKDDGYLYISVPTWFRILHNFGIESSFDIEYYYHPDHCNTWHEGHFRALLQQCGFKIVKEDHAMYDAAYLCVKAKEGEELPAVELLKPHQIKELLQAVKEASDACAKQEFEKALGLYANFPQAWRGYYEKNRAEFHKKGFDWIVENLVKKMMEIDSLNVEFYYIAADLHMRYNKYEEALGIIKTGLKLRPKCPSFLQNVGNCYRALGKQAADKHMYDAAANFYDQARKITKFLKETDGRAFAPSVTWIYNDNSLIPTPHEKAEKKGA